MTKTILLIDDKEDFLKPLQEQLRQHLQGDVTVLPWVPLSTENPIERFENILRDNDVRLVVTDYDLTQGGQLGFFGATVVDWCQNRRIPVGDFSRGNVSSLATEPNLFELRVPVESDEVAANYVASVYEGFEFIRKSIEENSELLAQRSPGAALATMLGVKQLESQFSQYGFRYGSANSALIDKFSSTAADDVRPSAGDKARVLTYIVGHLLLNAVLRFPGPILSSRALAAYLAIDPPAVDSVVNLFTSTRYHGPFSGLGPYYWTYRVDEVLEGFDGLVDSSQIEIESIGELNRVRIEAALETQLTRSNQCGRCQGRNGGFLCPFSDQTVCELPDCSVVSNIWIPAGARLSRFERDFYDEWAPILGM